MKSKRGQMTNALIALGVGIISLAIVLGTGIIVVTEFGGSLASCAANAPYNSTTDTCYNATSSTDPTGAWTDMNYIGGELGQNGLAGWIPAIIALTVGLIFLGAFVARGGRSF